MPSVGVGIGVPKFDLLGEAAPPTPASDLYFDDAFALQMFFDDALTLSASTGD